MTCVLEVVRHVDPATRLSFALTSRHYWKLLFTRFFIAAVRWGHVQLVRMLFHEWQLGAKAADTARASRLLDL